MSGEKISQANGTGKEKNTAKSNVLDFDEWLKEYEGYNNGELEAILGSLKPNGGIYAYSGVNGNHVLSSSMSIDDVYQEVLGCSRKQYAMKVFEIHHEFVEEKERLERQAEAKIPSWIERGKALVYPEKVEEWTDMVKVRAKGLFYGEDIEEALGVMEQLDAGVPVEEIREAAGGRNYIGTTVGSANAIVFAYSKRGPEFITGMLDNLSMDEVMMISNKQRQNSRLADFPHPKITKQRSAS